MANFRFETFQNPIYSILLLSYSKPLPSFTFDMLCYLNRDQLERLSIICRPLKNFIERYFYSKPYRIFDVLEIRGRSYALINKDVQWHPNRDDNTVQQFLAGDKHNIRNRYYTFAKMRPYLGPTVRIKTTLIVVTPVNWIVSYITWDTTYNPEHIAEMESIAYLWRDGEVIIWNGKKYGSRLVAEDFQHICNSPNILQCRELYMLNETILLKNFKVLYTVKIISVYLRGDDTDINHCLQVLEQPGIKPIVIMFHINFRRINNVLNHLEWAFLSADSPNAFKIVLVQKNKPLSEFRKTNKTSGEILELKKGLPIDCQDEYLMTYNNYTLERFSV